MKLFQTDQPTSAWLEMQAEITPIPPSSCRPVCRIVVDVGRWPRRISAHFRSPETGDAIYRTERKRRDRRATQFTA